MPLPMGSVCRLSKGRVSSANLTLNSCRPVAFRQNLRRRQKKYCNNCMSFVS